MEWSGPAKQAWFSNQKAVIRCSLCIFLYFSLSVDCQKDILDSVDCHMV